jgi:hypothetical protein
MDPKESDSNLLFILLGVSIVYILIKRTWFDQLPTVRVSTLVADFLTQLSRR